MNKFIFIFILGLMMFGFVSGTETSKMIIEPNRNYASSRMMISSQKNLAANEYGIFDLTDKEISELGKDPSIIVRKPYVISAFLSDAIIQQNVTTAWNLKVGEINLTGSQKSVCIIDTGIDLNHSDLEDKILAQHCFCDSSNCCPDGTAEDDNATDDNGHGTHVAGIVAADGQINGVGVGANLVIVKALDSNGDGNEVDLVDSIEWCVDNSEEYNITAISASLGADCDFYPELCYSEVCNSLSASLRNRIQQAIDKNISVVIATGNDGNATHISWPSCLPDVTRVASIDTDDSTISSFSNRNSLVKLFGVGKNVNSTMPTYDVSLTNSAYMSPASPYNNNYDEMSGTSMATPMIAGAIAIMSQYLSLSGQTRSPSEIEDIFYGTGKTVSELESNYSRINLYNAILSVDNIAPNVTLVSPIDEHINSSVNQNFVCNATDWQLANMTLKIWNSSGLYYNETNNLTGASNETDFNLTNISIGNYEWNCLVSDNLGNSAYASSNYSLTIGGVEVNMSSPSNDTYTKVNETNFTCISISESSYELVNITFSLWNSSGVLIYNLTKNITGFNNETFFNWTFEDEDDYSWECLAVNNNSYEGDGINYSISYDIAIPSIENISESVSTTSATIDWDSSELVNASINYGTSISLGSTSTNVNFELNHSIDLTGLSSSTLYYYNITSCDKANNCITNGTNSFTTSTSTVVIGGGGNSPSSGGPSSSAAASPLATVILNVSVSDISKGYTNSLEKGDKINFSIFDLAGGNHLLTVEEVGDDFVNLTIESDPINLILNSGESIKLNLTSPNYYDLYVKLNNVFNESANLTMQLINEPIELGEVEKTEIFENGISVGDYSWIVSVLAIFTIVFIIIAIIVNHIKLKSLKDGKKDGKKNKKTKA